MWCIPPEEDAEFACRMEQVLEVYKRPYDPCFPVVCMDEQPKQLISEKHPPMTLKKGQPRRTDYEYVREGNCVVWMFVEPLGGWRSVRVSARKTAVDWAEQVKQLVDDPRYNEAQRITLVCDNLNTHKMSSFYKRFEPQEAMRLMRKLELVQTPVHGSWLNMAEPELSVLTRQSLSLRLESQEAVEAQVVPWNTDRNAKQKGIDWQFTTEDARIKLKRLYPKILH